MGLVAYFDVAVVTLVWRHGVGVVLTNCTVMLSSKKKKKLTWIYALLPH